MNNNNLYKKISYNFILFFILTLTFQTVFSSINNKKKDALINVFEIKNVDSLITLSNRYIWTDKTLAENYINQALELSKEKSYEKGIAYSYHTLAKIFTEFDASLTEQLVLESLKYAKQLGDSILMAKNYNIIGVLKHYNNRSDDAFRYYNKALKIYKQYANDSAIAAIYLNIGNEFKENMDSALKYHFKAAEIYYQKNYLTGLTKAYLNIGMDYLVIGNLEKAKEYQKKGLIAAHKSQIEYNISMVNTDLARYHLYVGNSMKAIEHALDAYNYAKKLKSRHHQVMILRLLQQANENNNNINKAYDYLNELSLLKDTINLNNSLNKLELLELRNKYQIKIELQRVNYQKKRFFLITAVILLILFILIFILLFFLQKLNNRKKQVELEKLQVEKEQLNYKIIVTKKELSNNLLHLNNKNELINKIIRSLKPFRQNLTNKDKYFINSIILDLKSNLNNNIWNIFEKEFIDIHPNFLTNLLESHPNLTQKEKRLCSLIKLNLNTKEISNLLYIEPNSVEKARIRLRKKLNIAHTNVNLSVYLTKF